MHIVILDDEVQTLRYLESLLSKQYADAHTITTCSNAEELRAVRTDPDLLLSDIKLKGPNGIDEAMRFQKCHPKVRVIFITSYPTEYYEEIFNGIRPYAFLGKPIREKLLFKHIDELEQSLHTNTVFRFVFRGHTIDIPLDAIDHIESHGRQKFLYTDTEPYILNASFEELEGQLNDDFVRCHTAYTVNLRHVSAVSGDSIVMQGGAVLPIGRKFRQDFMTRYFLFKESRL